MAFGSDRSANFVIAAKDAATGPIGNIGKAMGRLKSSAGAAFKRLVLGLLPLPLLSLALSLQASRAPLRTNAQQFLLTLR